MVWPDREGKDARNASKPIQTMAKRVQMLAQPIEMQTAGQSMGLYRNGISRTAVSGNGTAQ